MRRTSKAEVAETQTLLRFSASDSDSGIEPLVVDLFAGMGGLSKGFRSAGFKVIGVDNELLSAKVFERNQIGEHVTADLRRQSVCLKAPILIGGPPCRPWSVMNVKRRRAAHGQYELLERFFDHVLGLKPTLFLMENVPSIGKDRTYQEVLGRLRRDYSVDGRILRYADFGAATKRRRLITVGVRGSANGASEFFEALDSEHAPPANVGEAIMWLRGIQRGGFPDHEWSELTTLDKYGERYSSGRFGWCQLAYGEAAPSFGSVAKTYVLHPESGENGFEKRVVSVREVLSIMGFERDFQFPEGASRVKRYQMVADAVSPVFSAACARAVKRLLWGETTQKFKEKD